MSDDFENFSFLSSEHGHFDVLRRLGRLLLLHLHVVRDRFRLRPVESGNCESHIQQAHIWPADLPIGAFPWIQNYYGAERRI